MTSTEGEPNWLNPGEMQAWRAYVIGSELLRQRLNRELEHVGMTLADYEVLVRLSERDDQQMRMSQLAEQVASSKSRLSHQVARLEKAGYVRRLGCPDDARGVIAELTAQGMAQLRAAAPTHVEGVREHLVELMSEEEQVVLAMVFERVIKHLDELKG